MVLHGHKMTLYLEQKCMINSISYNYISKQKQAHNHKWTSIINNYYTICSWSNLQMQVHKYGGPIIKLYMEFWLCGGQHPDPCIIQESAVYVNLFQNLA